MTRPTMRTHRPFQLAILESLADGAVHPRDEVFLVGIKACPQFESIGAYQRANPGVADELQALAGDRRGHEALRQQVEGARLLVTRAIKTLNDRNQIRAIRDGRRTLGYQITDKGRDYLANPTEEKPVLIDSHVEPCAICEGPLNPDDPNIWRYGIVWRREGSRTRRWRVIPVGETLKYAHDDCIDVSPAEDDWSTLTPEKIISAVEARFGMEPGTILEKDREGAASRSRIIPRRMAFYLILELLNPPAEVLTRILNRHYNTIHGPVNDFKAQLAENKPIWVDDIQVPPLALIEEIKNSLRVRLIKCVECGEVFEHPRQRGRPPGRCPDCR